jgi:riboflavin synthase
MFTGLVEEVGIVKSITPNKEGKEFTFESKTLISEIKIDDSISINGACQTAVKVSCNSFSVQAVHITLEKTTLGNLQVGEEVNMELAMRLSDRLGGHLVQGHVNDVGVIKKINQTGENYLVTVLVSSDQMKYIVQEGSITLDGISLTVAKLDKIQNLLTVSIIPHTWNNTVLKNRQIGTTLNVEVDIIGKYVENLLFHKGEHKKTSKITSEWLQSKGF